MCMEDKPFFYKSGLQCTLCIVIRKSKADI